MEATELWCLLDDTDDLFDGYIRVVYDEYNDSYYQTNYLATHIEASVCL